MEPKKKVSYQAYSYQRLRETENKKSLLSLNVPRVQIRLTRDKSNQCHVRQNNAW